MDSGCGSTNDAKVSLTERDIPCCLVMWKKSSRNDNSSTETLAANPAMSKCSIEREEGRSHCKVSVRVGLLLLVISIFGLQIILFIVECKHISEMDGQIMLSILMATVHQY